MIEGDYVRHRAAPDLGLLEIVRVEHWDQTVLVVRDATGEYDPRHTFKVKAGEAFQVPAPNQLVS